MMMADVITDFVTVPLGATGCFLIFYAVYQELRGWLGNPTQLIGNTGVFLVFISNLMNIVAGILAHDWAEAAMSVFWVAFIIFFNRDKTGRWKRKLRKLLRKAAGKVKVIRDKMLRKLRELKPRPALKPVPMPA